jgi:hypothetical protein
MVVTTSVKQAKDQARSIVHTQPFIETDSFEARGMDLESGGVALSHATLTVKE